MLKDTRYGPMSFELANTMSQRLEEQPYSTKEIAEQFGLGVGSVELKKVIKDAISILAEKRIPVRRLSAKNKYHPGGGIERIAADTKIQHSYDKQQRGMLRLHNISIADVKSINVASLNAEMQNAAIAINTTAKLIQVLATDESRDKLMEHIRNRGANLLDTRAVFAKLLEHNL